MQREVSPTDPPAQIELCLFGAFSLRRADLDITPPLGHPQTIIKLLALAGDWVSIDSCIDALWPDASPQLGRRRLRNVICRAQRPGGVLIERRGDIARLARGAAVDIHVWRKDVGLAVGREALEVLARRAPDELLPADRYEEWLQPHQRRYRFELLGLLDRLAAAACAAGDFDAAVSAWSRALDVDPHAIDRINAMHQALRSEGRCAEAADVHRRWEDPR